MKPYDAVVVGAGPAGSSAALLLARMGWRVALVEKARFPRRKVCGEFIAPACWPLLEALGVAPHAARLAGPPVERVGLYAGEGTSEADMPAPGTLPWGMALGREHLDTLLAEGAARAGAEFLQPWAAESVEPAEDGFDFHVECIEGGAARTLHARVAILAQGSWERGLAIQRRVHAASRDLLGFKAHFAGAALPRGLMPLVLFPGGYGGLVQTDGARVSFSCCIRRDALARARRAHPGASAGDALLAHVATSCRGVRQALGRARCEGAWLSIGPVRPGIHLAKRPGVFTLGNAAGEAHPIVAEGISMAIQSAFLACAALGTHGAGSAQAIAKAQAEYHDGWRRHLALRVRAAALIAHLTGSPLTARASVAAMRTLPGLITFGAWLSGKNSRIALRELAA